MDGSSFGRAERFAVGGREGWNLGTGKGRRGRERERGEEGGSSCLSRRALCMHLNTSLSNLSTCQQHMFGKKRERAVGRREEREKKNSLLLQWE